jgi:hypothetical protein
MIRGNHSIKTGVDMRQYSLHVHEDTRPQFGFFARYTGNSFADYLLGYSSVTGNVGTSSLYNLHHREFNSYVQDDWKVTSKLSLNLGVRYELKLPWLDKRGLSRNWSPATGDFFPPEVQETLQAWQTSRYTPNYPLITFPQAGAGLPSHSEDGSASSIRHVHRGDTSPGRPSGGRPEST